MLDINTSPITLKTIIDEDGSFSFTITPSITFSSPEKFRWEITFGQGTPQRGVITFKAGEPDSKSIPQSIDPDEHYQLRVFRVSDNNNDAADALVFQQQSEHLPLPLPLPLPLNNAPQQSRVGGDQEPPVTDITQVKASLVLNKDEVTIIDATALLYKHPADPNAVLTYTLTADPAGGDLFLGDVELANGDTFTQSDINAHRLTFRFTADNNDPTDIAFTVSDGTLTLSGQTLTITPRVVVEVVDPEEDNTEDLSSETAPQKIDAEGGNDTITGGAGDDQIDGGLGDDTIDGGGGNDVIDGGDSSDSITGGAGDDQIDGGAGDDDITLTHDGEDGDTVDFSSNEVVYTFGYDGVGIDGGDEIKGFKRGQDTLKFVVRDIRQFADLKDFLGTLNGADNEDLNDDDAFIVSMMWGLDEEDAFYFDGVLLHFKDATSFGGGRVSSPLVSITFDQRLGLNDLIQVLGGANEVAENFNFTHAAFKNLDEVLPRLFGESSIDFEVLTTTITVSGDVTEDDESAKTATGTLDDDNNPLTPPPIIELVGDGVGTYGTMTFDAVTREWTYTLDNIRLETQALQVGQQETETFIFTTQDTRFIVTITVQGANDLPVAGTIETLTVTVGRAIEAIDLSDLFTDVDSDELTLVVTFADGSAVDTIGLTYDPINKILSGTPDTVGTHTIKVVATDDRNGSSETTFNIEVLVETIEGTARGEVTEDDDTNTATGTLTAIDDGAPLTPTPIIELVGDGVGTYGMMTFDVDEGEWTYTLDNTRPETQVLKADQQEAETFTFTAADGIFTVTITVNGADDKPVANTKFFEASGAVGREITIDPNTLFNDPDGEDLELTFTVMLLADDSTREEISTIGLSYNPLTKMITGTPTKPGFYTLEVAASYSGGAKDDIVTTFGITVLSKFFGQIQFDALNGVEDIAFDERAEITLNDIPGSSHAESMEAIANAFKTDVVVNPYVVHITAREGGDDIIASPNNGFFSVLDAIHRVSDQSTKERAIERLKGDLAGDILLVSAGNTGQLLDHAFLEEKWVHDLLDNEDVNVFFVIGIITKKDGEKEIESISSTLPISYSDNVIGASLEVPILIGGEVEIPGGTSSSAVLTAIFFARLQVLLPEASFEELIEIGKWLLEPLEDTLGIISFEKLNEISLNFSKDIEDLLLAEILDYVRSNPKKVLYTFSYDGVGIDGGDEIVGFKHTYSGIVKLANIDGGDEIVGFKRGLDKVTFVVQDGRNFANLKEFLESLNGADNEDLTVDDAFIVTMMWGLDEEDAFYFDGVVLHFKDATSFGGGRISSPLVQITFDERLGLDDLIEILGGADNVADNFDGGLTAFKNLDEVLPRLFGGGSIDFKVLTTTITVSGDVTEDDESAKTATLTAIDDGDPLTPPPIIELVGDGVGTYGMMTFDVDEGEWTYTLDNTRPETQMLKADQQEDETFTFTAADGIFTVTITVNGADDKLVANTKFFEASGAVGREITIDPNTLFNNPDGEDLELTFTVMLLADDSTREEISTIGLSYNPLTKMITGTPTKSGSYILEVAASYSGGAKDDIVTTFGITVVSKILRQKQLDALNGVEDIAFDERAEITLNDPPGPHQENMEAIANAFKTDVIVSPYFADVVAREGGDDIIASSNPDNFFMVLDSIHRVSDQSSKEAAIERLKGDLAGDILLVSAGNTGQLLDYAVLEEKWVQDLLDNEDVNVFFVIGIITNEDGEKEISPISSTLPISYSDNVIGAEILFPISDESSSYGTSTSTTLAATFFARLQVLLPEASFEELIEIGKWLLEPLENSLGAISFEKFEEISLNFSKDIEDLLLEEILDYVRSNPRDDENPTLEEGLSGASPEDLLQSVEVIYDPPIIDDLPVIAEI